MNTVNYNSKFKKAIELAKDKDLFLGSGNPNAKIALVGKEAAIDLLKFSDQHKREIINNAADWDSNYDNKIQFSEIDNWFTLPKYNPLYPYKGQKNNVESRNETGDIIGGRGGTSKTWYNYQKIIDKVHFNDIPSKLINFHEYAFITELNQITGSYSKNVPKKIRKDSITKRKELFKEPFFKDFTITIIAVGHYVRDFDIDLQNIFQVKFHEQHSKELSESLNKEYINVHYNDLEKPTKLLIHTNQLSMVSNELINRLGKFCNDFKKLV
ncbi:hypothetical protein ACM55G_08320 [Flavobacterium sp. LB3P122]|uniref:hypothetical protein n=1 Tax=Flavobacterium algoriphilum TaxID=3398738 RepID=UPI003A86E449